MFRRAFILLKMPDDDKSMSVNPERWVESHGDYLYRYALSLVRDPQVAEDCVQETLVSALKSRETFSGQSTERAWLSGILKHKMMDYFRKINRERPVSSLETDEELTEDFFDKKGMWKMDTAPSEWTMEPHAALMQKEFMRTLQNCLQKLPGRLSQLFTLVEMDGLSSNESCKVLNITATNLWVMLYRARMGLRKCLEKNWFGKEKEKSK